MRIQFKLQVLSVPAAHKGSSEHCEKETLYSFSVHNHVCGCSFPLPEAFSESEDIEGMYVTRRYPIDASTIYYVALGRDVALQLMTEETFKAYMDLLQIVMCKIFTVNLPLS